MKRGVLCTVCVVAAISVVAAGDIGFIEQFAISRDRSNSLKQLIPGTEDYYYYHALLYLQQEQFQKAEEIAKTWEGRLGQTARWHEIQARHALLTYDRTPERSLAYLRDKLGLSFHHEKEVLGAVPQLPTKLDPQLISWERLKSESLRRWELLENFEDAALDWLAVANLNWQRRRQWLQRLARPDVPQLPRWVAEDLAAPNAPSFGAYGIHRQLTQNQLDELVKLRPELLNQTAYVQTYLTKLHPGADEDWRRTPALTQAYFERLWNFARRLNASHHSLQANILYHWLVFDRSQGRYDLPRFLEYLKLPRFQPYMAKAMLEGNQQTPVDMNADFQPLTFLPPILGDEPLVRSYLKRFFAEASSPKEFEPYINDVYLRHLFAETKTELGLGDPEQWASALPPELFQQFKERVDIDFDHANPTHFSTQQAVRLDVHLKNVPKLLVKVFEINTANYYRDQQREINTDVNLDGLVANEEQSYDLAESPLRRVTRRFEFPRLQKPGVYVVDFIGAGKSSRALVRKGRLRPIVSTASAGTRIIVVDEENKKVKDVVILLGGQEYRANADGVLMLPFSTQPGPKSIIIQHGDFACLDTIQHAAESYRLEAGIHVERESLLSQRVAKVLVRPGLFLNNQPVSVKLLEEVKLRITSTDQDGISTSSEVPDFKLFEDRESTHEFRVPARLATLHFNLQARIMNASLQKKIDVAAAQQFTLNSIDQTDKVEDVHLARFGKEYVLELLGKTGEAKPDRPIHLELKNQYFREPVRATLKSDAQGRVHLGELTDIVSLSARGPEQTQHSWSLPLDRYTYRHLLHARAGEVITLPYLRAAPAPRREDLALFEMRGDFVKVDRFERLGLQNGLLKISGLEPGDYTLWLKDEGQRIQIRVVAGEVSDGYVLGTIRHLELPGLKPLQIAGITPVGDGGLTIQLANASPFTRVHVLATRYIPEYSAFANLSRVRDAELSGVYPTWADSVYLTGRNIGDEYRYVLDRKGQRRFPGNMLERPQLLLNPWAVRSTETGEQFAAGGDNFTPRSEPAPSTPAPGAPPRAQEPAEKIAPLTANLDYLADAASVVANAVPDQNGMIKLDAKDLGPHALIQVVAVDPLQTTSRWYALPERKAEFMDLRMRRGLDSKAHFTQQKQVSILPPGKPFTLPDITSSRFENYDSLSRVYHFYVTLTKDPTLTEFAFILNWPSYKPEEKRKYYSQYACHELNFFLSRKDPEFFQAVIKPYLANKKDKTFLDEWLLEVDLTKYLDPWRFGRLNVAERALLARRIAGEAAHTRRHLEELQRLLPPQNDRSMVLFDTAIKSGALAKSDSLGLVEAQEKENKAGEVRLGGMMRGAASQPAGGGTGMGGGGLAANRADAPAKAETATRDADKKALREEFAQRKMKDAEGKDAAGRYFFQDEREKARVRQLFRRLPPTQEWAENNYYHLPIAQQIADRVPVNPFWVDFSQQDGSPFLSRHFPEASRNFTEMMLALAALELPFSAGKHEVKFEGAQMTLTPAHPVIAFYEAIRPSEAARTKLPILVSQHFYRVGDRFRQEQGERVDHFITDEFLMKTAYGCQVVVTNPTSSRQKLTVLIQLPMGAMPLARAHYTRSIPVDLEPYRTQTLDYLFYFPLPGTFAHFPVHVAKNEQFVASTEPFTFKVVEKPTKIDTNSWEYISQNGTPEQVLELLRRENIQTLNLDKIAFRMKDQAFFESVTSLLRERHVYHSTLWSYAILHNSVMQMQEYLRHADSLVALVGNGPLQSTLLTIDPVARHLYEHLEYKPLVNARAHSLGQQRQIVNDRLLQHYQHFLKMLSYQRSLEDDDYLALTYYLLLQDRFEESLETFARVRRDKVASHLQYDYCAAYLMFLSDEPGKARALAAAYANHPVDRWRHAFTTMIHQLDEIEGRGAQVADPENREQRQGQLAAGEPSFGFTLDAKKIQLNWQNIHAVRVNYYLMDVELLFSRNPFVQQYGSQFSAIKPNQTQVVQLPAGQRKMDITLPVELASKNILVEISAAGKTQSLPYYAHALELKLQENYGELRVTETATGKPLAKVYVKIYARLATGEVKFHKDGYTDHRGKFDYVSVSTPEKSAITNLAVLVLSQEHGAVIREVAPPAQ